MPLARALPFLRGGHLCPFHQRREGARSARHATLAGAAALAPLSGARSGPGVADPTRERLVLKVLRWLLPLTLLLAGCGLLPTGTSPTQPAAPPAGPTTGPAAGAPTAAGAPPAGTGGSVPAASPPPPSPSPSPSPTPI